MSIYSSFIRSADDDDGTVSWFEAVKFARQHDWYREFLAEYDNLAGERIDVGELGGLLIVGGAEMPPLFYVRELQLVCYTNNERI